ncbi:MAG: helix-turn-helix transcriptional regulator [Lachnospiraceae bacterium]|nr:helix-turn-helix transcriptional regulator [Lachnospiraceae bacterium]
MFQVRYVVLKDVFEEGFVRNYQGGISVWLLVVFKTKTRVYIGEQVEECPPETFVLYPPRYPIHYEGMEGEHREAWIQFASNDSYLVEPFVPFGRPTPLINPYDFEAIMRVLAYENIAGYCSRESSMEALMRLIVNKIHDSYLEQNEVCTDSRLTRLRSEIYQHPNWDWNIRMMSERVFISESRLHTIYKAAFHITCMNDVIMSRIQYAQNLLECTEKSISEIAVDCGYHGNEHFCRQFKEKTGLTPGQYREKNSLFKRANEE